MKEDELKVENQTPEEPAKNGTEVKFEENDNWKFDGVAHTLSDDFLQSVGVEDASKYETAVRPTKKVSETTQVSTTTKKKGIKGDKLLLSFIAVVLVATIAVLAVLGSFYYNQTNSDERMNAGNVAMTIGDTKVSVGMYNYYYTCISQNYISYASYYGLDASKPFDEQKTTDEDGKSITWAEKFKEETIDQIQYITAYYEEAVANGVTLTDAQKKTIKQNLDSLKESATSEGENGEAVSVDKYIENLYGEGCGYATLEKMLTQCYIAENYYQQKRISQRVTPEDEKAYYEKHKDEYTKVKLAYLQIPYGETAGITHEKALENSKNYANSIKTVNDLKKLIPTACKALIDSYVAQGYAQDAASCAEMLASNVEVSVTKDEDGLVEGASEWLFGKDTKVGDCKAFDDADNSIIFIFLKTSDPAPDTSKVYSVRHILVMPNADKQSDDGQQVTYTDEEWKAAKEKADKILAEYNKGSKTEVAFAKLAEKYSDDTESTSAGTSGIYGGLTEGITLGSYVKEYENWSVDESRKYGDTGIIKSQYGYHVMFFVESTEQYLYDCSAGVRSELEDEFIKETKVKQHSSVMKKLKVAEPVEEENEESEITETQE